MSKHMSNRMWDGMGDNLSDRLPARTPNRMPEYMPDKMRNRISEYMLIYLFPWESHETKQFLQDISSTACSQFICICLFEESSEQNFQSEVLSFIAMACVCLKFEWCYFLLCVEWFTPIHIYIYMQLILNLYMHIFLRIVAWFMLQTGLWFQDVSTLRSTIAANGPISRGLSY